MLDILKGSSLSVLRGVEVRMWDWRWRDRQFQSDLQRHGDSHAVVDLLLNQLLKAEPMLYWKL